jgi:hypothetical protein
MNSIFFIYYFSVIIMKNNIVSILLVILLISCHKKEAPVPIDSNKNFDKYKEALF